MSRLGLSLCFNQVIVRRYVCECSERWLRFIPFTESYTNINFLVIFLPNSSVEKLPPINSALESLMRQPEYQTQFGENLVARYQQIRKSHDAQLVEAKEA